MCDKKSNTDTSFSSFHNYMSSPPLSHLDYAIVATADQDPPVARPRNAVHLSLCETPLSALPRGPAGSAGGVVDSSDVDSHSRYDSGCPRRRNCRRRATRSPEEPLRVDMNSRLRFDRRLVPEPSCFSASLIASVSNSWKFPKENTPTCDTPSEPMW